IGIQNVASVTMDFLNILQQQTGQSIWLEWRSQTTFVQTLQQDFPMRVGCSNENRQKRKLGKEKRGQESCNSPVAIGEGVDVQEACQEGGNNSDMGHDGIQFGEGF
ncbi:hypothetical protein HDU81_001694, partial [Chytriomyces hyalinus]